MHLFIHFDIYKMIVPGKFTYCLSNLIKISLMIMPGFIFTRRKIMYFKIFAEVRWWWHFGCTEERSLNSITEFRCIVKNRSIRAEESPTKCMCSLIISCNPACEVTPLVLEPSYAFTSVLYLRWDFESKSRGIFNTLTDYSRQLKDWSKLSWKLLQ